MRLLPALLCLSLLPAAAHAAPACSLPASLDARQFTNLSDPHYRPDNPHAGRMVQVDFGADQYTLAVLGTPIRVPGQYRYQRHAPHLAEIHLREAYPGGTADYTLLLTCLTDSEGMFVYTQHAGPIGAARRQNSGRWTLR